MGTVRFAPNAQQCHSCPLRSRITISKGPTAYIALGELGDVKLETGAAYISP